MKATIIPNAKIKALAKGYLTKKIAAIKKMTPIVIAIIEICLVKRLSSAVNGLDVVVCFCVKLAIRPNSVFIPVAKAIARALPAPTVVPE